MTAPNTGENVTTTTELVEAYGLGASVAEIRTTLGFVRESGARTEHTAKETLAKVSAMEVAQGQHGEQIKTAFNQIADVKGEVNQLREELPRTYATKADLTEVKDEVKGGRLSWPKLLAGMGGISAALIIANLIGDALK